MSQSSHSVGNVSAPAFRSAMNDSLQALASLNSGPSAPSTTYANMLWYDTSENTLYMRSEADDAWIVIGTLNQSTNTFTPANAVPIGAVTYLAGSSAPDGWLKANGASVSRTSFAGLFSVIGTTYGVGNGSTTFNLPDLRGQFLRGFDDGRGIDIGRAFASAQLDQMQRITGFWRNERGSRDAAIETGGAVTHSIAGGNGASGVSGNHLRFDFDSANSPNARVSSTTSGETRPRNVALLACIKF